MSIYNPSDVNRIKVALEKLFALQDKPLTEKKKLFIVDELIKDIGELDAILKGVTALNNVDVKSLKYTTIRDNCRKHLKRKQVVYLAHCKICDSSGIVTLLSQDDKHYAYACKCGHGSKYQYLPKWNGKVKQDDMVLWLYKFLGKKTFNELYRRNAV